jgi:ribosome-associated heat shock protein Hsp15
MCSQGKTNSVDKFRIDKWLWCVRLYKTRSLATTACNAGKVKIGGQNCKPSREVREGDTLQVRVGELLKEVEVIGFPTNRIAAKFVPECYTDRTPPTEYERVRLLRYKFEYREGGLGRPTKRERRQLDCIKNMIDRDTKWMEEENS